MPPRRPAPRRRKHSASASAQPPDKQDDFSQENIQQTSFVIGGGDNEVRWLWPMLNRFEKFHILDVTADEILMALFQLTEVPEETRTKIAALLNDQNYATNMRVLFVAGLDPSTTEIPLPADFPPASLAFLKVLDRHLIETYRRYHSSALLGLFIFSSLLFGSYFGFFFKFLLIISFGIFLGIFPERKLWLIPQDIFEEVLSNSPERIQSLITTMMLYSLCYWSPHCALLKWVSLVPYLLLILKDYVSTEDVRPLQLFHWLISTVMKFVLLYFAWYSWIWTLMVLTILLPSLFVLTVHIVAFLCQASILLLDFVVERVAILNRFTSSLMDIVVFPVMLFYALYFRSYWAGALTAFLTPALGRNALMGLASTIVPHVMGRTSPITVFTFLQLGLRLVTILFSSCIAQLLQRIHSRRSQTS